MTDADEYVGWRKLREFAGVDLTKSFVLSWHVEVETLMIDGDDPVLWPAKPQYWSLGVDPYHTEIMIMCCIKRMR